MISDKELFDQATEASKNAVCDTSKFPVGAALLAADGRVFTGCNIESPSLIQVMCAERVALLKALSEGARDFVRIALATPKRPGASPCGFCRQMLHEFAPELQVVMIDNRRLVSMPLSDLLPLAFTFEKD